MVQLASVAQAYAKAQDSMSDKLTDVLVNRALKVWPLLHSNLDETALAKPSGGRFASDARFANGPSRYHPLLPSPGRRISSLFTNPHAVHQTLTDRMHVNPHPGPPSPSTDTIIMNPRARPSSTVTNHVPPRPRPSMPLRHVLQDPRRNVGVPAYKRELDKEPAHLFTLASSNVVGMFFACLGMGFGWLGLGLACFLVLLCWMFYLA